MHLLKREIFTEIITAVSRVMSVNVDIILFFRLPMITITKANNNATTRGSKTSTFYENNDIAPVQTSPSATIEDTSTSPLQDIDNRLKTLQIPSRS